MREDVKLLRTLADELPMLARFIGEAHGPIGWEHTVESWAERARAALARAEAPERREPSEDESELRFAARSFVEYCHRIRRLDGDVVRRYAKKLADGLHGTPSEEAK